MVVSARTSDFSTLASLGLKVDASAFYPSIEPYYGKGSLPFLRVSDVGTYIDWDRCTSIPKYLCKQYPTLEKVKNGDILLTKGGSIARVGLVTHEAAVSRDLIFINSSKLSERNQDFLYLYFQTEFFNRFLVRSSSQTAQPHLTITLVRDLPILSASDTFKLCLSKTVRQAFLLRKTSIDHIASAEQTLLHALGLDTWTPPEALSYERSSREAFAAGRLDAEHFQPKFQTLMDLIRATGDEIRLGNHLAVNQRGKQPDYVDEGLPVINSKHVLCNEVRLDEDNRQVLADEDAFLIETGDVLINGTGVGTIGRAAAYLYTESALPDNHVTILRPCEGLDPVYLAVFLNSTLGQLQVEQRLRGSSGQIELYPSDIAEFQAWLAPEELQLNIRKQIQQSFEHRQQATRILDTAKRAVEIAIEDSEAAALEWLRSA